MSIQKNAKQNVTLQTEVERKWRLEQLPQLSLEIGNRHEIRQGYLITEGGEMRVRAKGEKFFITAKSDGSLSRSEWEEEIPQWVFDLLWSNTNNKTLEKIRYSVPYGNLTLEIDVYLGRLSGLLIVEIEFANEAQALAFDISAIAPGAVEVTADKRYKNKNLAVACSSGKDPCLPSVKD